MSQNKFTTNNNPTLVAVSTSDGETPVYLYADPSTHGLVIGGIVTISSTVNPAQPTALIAFTTTVTTAGTRVQLASNVLTVGAILEAPSTNTGLIYVGGVTVSSTVFGAELQPGQSTSVAIDNTSRIYIDSSVNGDKLSALGS